MTRTNPVEGQLICFIHNPAKEGLAASGKDSLLCTSPKNVHRSTKNDSQVDKKSKASAKRKTHWRVDGSRRCIFTTSLLHVRS